MVLLAVADHKYRIEVGYGLEGILPDGKTGDIGRDMVPDLRAGDYDGAVTLAVGEMAQVIAADAKITLRQTQPCAQRRARPQHQRGIGGSASIILTDSSCSFFFGGWLAAAHAVWLGRACSLAAGAAAAGAAALVAADSAAVVVGLAVVVAGFGGFGGGGGGFGGGGAGGSW